MIINNMTALEWLESEFVKLESTIGVYVIMYELIEQAKEKEKQQKIELLKWRETRFTKDAPLEYVLNEFEKL